MEKEDCKIQIEKLSNHNGKLKISLAVTLALIAYVLVNHFEDHYVTLGHAVDGVAEEEVYAVHSRWWGLSKTKTRIKWTTPSSDKERNIDFQDWCYEYSPSLWISYYSSY